MFWCEEWFDFPVCLRNLLTRDLMQNQDAWTPTTQKLNYYVFFSESVGFDFDSWSGFYIYIYIYPRSSLLVSLIYIYIFYIYNPGYPDQFVRTTTNSRIHWTPYKSSVHVKHYEDDRHAQRELNLDTEKETSP